MAKLVITNATVSLAGTDISTSVAAVTLSSSVNEVETTAMGNTAVTRVSGLIDNSITMSLHQEYSTIEGLVFPFVGSTAVTVIVTPNGTAVSTANPRFTASVLITEWNSVNGAVGELATVDVTWPISGTVTKATA